MLREQSLLAGILFVQIGPQRYFEESITAEHLVLNKMNRDNEQ